MSRGIDRALVDELATRVVDRRRELEIILAGLASGRHVLLEGPPGTGKSTLLRAIAEVGGTDFVFVEGNAELTPGRLVGHFDPSVVLDTGYAPSAFIDGPLITALRTGGLLYVEELNRVPEETLNVVITVMSEGELHVPRLGRVEAADGFRLVAAMNPFDAVGTARISSAVYDRMCRVTMSYQSAAAEVAIAQRAAPDADPTFVGKVVDVVRSSREHPDVRVGSSVRGAIDLVLLANELATLRGGHPSNAVNGLDAALAALSGRLRVHEGGGRVADDIVAELWWSVFAGEQPTGTGDGESDPKA